MVNLSISDVVSRLIGYTEPYGDSNVDAVRFNNQEELIKLCRDIIKTLQDNEIYWERTEGSMRNIGVSSRNYLIELKNELVNYFN